MTVPDAIERELADLEAWLEAARAETAAGAVVDASGLPERIERLCHDLTAHASAGGAPALAARCAAVITALDALAAATGKARADLLARLDRAGPDDLTS